MIDDLDGFMCSCGFVACPGSADCWAGPQDNEENDPAFWDEVPT